MNLKRYISSAVFAATVAAAALVVLSFAGCSDDGDMRAKEEETIIKYLTSKNYTEEDYIVIDGVYRVITGSVFDNIPDPEDPEAFLPEPEGLPEVKTGSRMTFNMELYVFSGAEPSAANLIYTNKEELIDKNINSEYWPKVLKITIGEDEIIRGVDIALPVLPACRLGDLVTFIIPSNMGYGGNDVGNYGKDKILFCKLEILEVNEEAIADYMPEETGTQE